MLTKEELEQLNMWLSIDAVGNMAVERPVVASTALLEDTPVPVLIGADVRLSETSRREQQRKYVREKRVERAKARRAAKARKGRSHHKKKEATKRRQALKRWTEQPYKSVVYGYGVYDISQEEWDYFLAPYWERYNPKHLHIKKTWGKGTKKEPYTIWDVRLYYKDKLVWNGPEEKMWYVLSQPNELDRELAPSGEQLFKSVYYLSKEKLLFYSKYKL